jgi:peptidoglycan/LPS O-acetylase OafA/YrhL
VELAVEEQFYLVWPLVMIGLMRLGRRRLPS